MSKMSRTKGKVGELEVVHMAWDNGFPKAKRTSDGQTQTGRGDIGGIPAVYMECRRRESFSIWACMEEITEKAATTDLPVLAFRRNRTPWYGALLLDELFPLLRLRDV